MASPSPFIQFPLTNETAEGVVHSGVFGPCTDGTYTVVAICPDSRRKPYYETSHTEYSEAVRSAEQAYLWFDQDESQMQKELVSS